MNEIVINLNNSAAIQFMDNRTLVLVEEETMDQIWRERKFAIHLNQRTHFFNGGDFGWEYETELGRWRHVTLQEPFFCIMEMTGPAREHLWSWLDAGPKIKHYNIPFRLFIGKDYSERLRALKEDP